MQLENVVHDSLSVGTPTEGVAFAALDAVEPHYNPEDGLHGFEELQAAYTVLKADYDTLLQMFRGVTGHPSPAKFLEAAGKDFRQWLISL